MTELTQEQLKTAAEALVACGYGTEYFCNSVFEKYYIVLPAKQGMETVDPLNNEYHRQALLEWFKVYVVQVDSGNKWSWYADEHKDGRWWAYGDTRKAAENACLIACLESEK